MAVRDSASVADTLKLNTPAALGVPDIIPVAAARPSPAGNPPAVTAHV